MKHKHLLVFSAIYFILCFVTYKNFGATYDEHTEYAAGKFSLKYYKTPTTVEYMGDLSEFNPRRVEHRQIPIFSEYSRFYPMVLNIFNPNYFLEWFHLQNIIFGYFLFLAAYILFFLVYKKSSKSIVAPVLLFLTPVITGHLPANPKDIPFATAFLFGLLGIYFFHSYLDQQGKRTELYLLLEVVSLGLVFGFAQSLRTIGLTLFAVYLIYGLLLAKSSRDVALHLVKMVVISLLSLLVWLITVPYIGANVFANLPHTVTQAMSFKDWDFEVLYFGKFLLKNQRPWHYLPIHLLIQLPLITLFGLFMGMFARLTTKLRYPKEHPIFLMSLAIVINILLYLILNPVVYNGLRHFLYLVVLLTLVSGFVLIDFYHRLDPKRRYLLLCCSLTYGLLTFVRMINLHPYEYIYYNEAVGGLRGAEGRFELDYWGAAYKEATEYLTRIVAKNNLPDLRVFACDEHFAVDYFNKNQFRRVSASKDSDVILCDTFKVRLREATDQKSYTETHLLVKTIQREGVPIHMIYATPEFADYFD